MESGKHGNSHGDAEKRRSALVTGGAGFVGSHVVSRLLDANTDVTVVDNFFTGKVEFLPRNENMRLIECDICSREDLDRVFALSKPDIVIHLAAIHYIPFCDQNPLMAVNVNVDGTRNVFECARRYLPEVVFFASTAAVYPISDLPHCETSDVGPIDIYGKTKLIGEELAELFFRRTGVPTIIGRLFNVFGKNETNPHLIPELVDQILSGKRSVGLGNLEPKRDFIHVEDVSRAVSILVDHVREGLHVFNIGSGRQYSVLDVVKAMERALDDKIAIIQDAKRTRSVDRPFLMADISKISNNTGWMPQKELEAGLRELLKAQ